MSMTTHLRDIELATSGIDPTPHDAGHTWAIASFRSLGAFISETFHRSAGSQAYEVFQGYQIEDQPTGYPQFSSLMASHENFQIFRRFSNVRTRLALLAQDRVTQLDSRLREIDETEASPIFLASSRTDRNEERQLVQAELRDALKDYDEMLERAVRISVLGTAQPQDVTSLQNWNDLTAGMSREETEFLTHREDLLCLSVPGDGLLSWLERYISERLLSLSKRSRSYVSRNPRVHIYSRYYVGILTRAILIPVLVVLVVTPMVICNAFESLRARLAIIIVATTIFLTVLALSTRGKVLELAVAGVTYTTVLVIFISPSS